MEQKLRTGDTRADGFVFTHYRKNGTPIFTSPQAYQRYRIGMAFTNSRINAQKAGVAHDITMDHLLAIWPADGRCPILGTLLTWGETGGRCASPSLDRRDPAKGYTVGNVCWLSSRANRMKAESTTDDLRAMIQYLNPLVLNTGPSAALTYCPVRGVVLVP